LSIGSKPEAAAGGAEEGEFAAPTPAAGLETSRPLTIADEKVESFRMLPAAEEPLKDEAMDEASENCRVCGKIRLGAGIAIEVAG